MPKLLRCAAVLLACCAVASQAVQHGLPKSYPRQHQQSQNEQPMSALPPSGFFMVFEPSFVQSVVADFSLMVANEAAAYTDTPDVSGSADGVSYTFSSFRYHMSLEDPTVSVTPTGLKLVWNKFKFLITFNYHVHKIVSENGLVAVFTTTAAGSTLEVDLAVDLKSPTVSVSAVGTTLNIPANAAQVLVQCTSTLCLIPVSDVSKAIAENFVTGFDKAVNAAANTAAATYADALSTMIELTDLELNVNAASSLAQVGSNIVVLGLGAVVPRADPSYMPFSAAVTPPSSFFSSPSAPVSIALTNFVAKTGMAAAAKAGYFSQTVTDADVPADSPIRLETNNYFWLSAVPGIAAYPNMNITVNTFVPNLKPAALFDANFVAAGAGNGVVVNVTLSMNFTLVNSTLTHPGFALQLSMGTLASFKATDNVSTKQIQLTPSFSDWDIMAKTISTALGPIKDDQIDTLMQLVVGLVVPTAPIEVPWPANYDLRDASLTFNKGFATLNVAPSYNQPIPSTACGPTERCAATLSCCTYTSNNYECCVFSSATCCSSYCCPQNWQCCGTNSCCEPLTGREWNLTQITKPIRA